MLTPSLAVEKVLFRLALRHEGVVPLARAFLELPLSLEEVEAAADAIADGRGVVKNEWGEFLTYEFPELMRLPATAPPDCPTCGGEPPAAPTEGGAPVRAPLVCDGCYRILRRGRAPGAVDSGAFDKLKALFRAQSVQDARELARLEHEIFFLGLGLGADGFTHTAIAAQSRLPALRLKACLDGMAARRYIHVGLLPSGDAVAYRFPPGLDYPRVLYARLGEPEGAPVGKRVRVGERDDAGLPGGAIKVGGPEAAGPAPTPPPAAPNLKIVIKDRRTRPGR